MLKKKSQVEMLVQKCTYSEFRFHFSISEIETMISKAKQLIESSNKFEVIVGLCLLTGRRESEIALTARFEPVSVSEYIAMFYGQSKNQKEFSIVIPLLDNVHIIQDRIEFVQKYFAKYKDDARKFSLHFQNIINQYVRFCFCKYNQNITANVLRAVYVNYLWIELNKGTHARFLNSQKKQVDYTLNGFVSAILGHNDNDLTTSNSYIPNVKIIN